MATVESLMPVIAGLVIAPLVQKIKAYWALDPRWIATLLSLIAVFGITLATGGEIAPDNLDIYVKLAVTTAASIGTATVAHTVKKTVEAK